MNSDLEEFWYYSATIDFRVTLDPKKPVTYWLVTYLPPMELLEIRFVYEQVGGDMPTPSVWQQIIRDHFSTVPVT